MLASLCTLLYVASVSADCHAAPDCQTCIGGANCGWCAVNVTFPTQVGPQCVDLHETFDCDVQFQTDKCVQGWKCAGSGNTSQCVPSVGGVADKAACEKSCKKPPSPPKPPPPPKPKKAYTCNNATLTCEESKFPGKGEPSMQICQQHCKVTYQCDDASQTCKKADPSAPGIHYDDNATCAAVCPARPTPVPYELRGVFRGFAIHNSYVPGEWVANFTAQTAAIWFQTATGYSLYVRGTATAVRAPGSIAGTYVLVIDSVAGKLKGSVRMLAGDYSQNPEVTGFLSLAVDEAAPTTEPSDFDSAMKKSAVLALETCPTGGASPPPAPPPPTPGPPPPCKAKLDVSIILDGSASIISSDWQKALAFTNKLIDGFHVSADEVEIGIVQFASNARVEVPLSADAAALKAAVSRIRQMRMNTNTYDGFSKAKTMLDNGRKGTKGKLAILMTDGRQNQGLPAKGVADAMQKEGIQVFGIGVGSAIDEQELKSWCSPPLSDHYFTVSAFSALEKILQQIIANACPHPPPPPTHRLLQVAPPAKNSTHPCKFHLPANLPLTYLAEEHRELSTTTSATVAPYLDVAPLEEQDEEELQLVEDVDVNGTDPCNNFTSCSTCIGAHVGGKTCGWCTAPVSYHGQTSKFQCAGKDAGSSSPKFTCAGHYKTSTCDTPGGCGLKGKFRGIRIDNTYQFGEYTAEFTQGAQYSEHAKIQELDGSGKAIKTTEGELKCSGKCSDGKTLSGTNFTLTTTSGQILKGICGYTQQIQAETSGLMWAISSQGVATPPADFDKAMNSTTAQEFTFYKCVDFKKGVCEFK